MFFFEDPRLRRAVAIAFFITIGAAIGLGAWHANGAELDGAWFGQSVLVVLAFTFAMRTSQEFRDARSRRERQSAGRDRQDRAA